MTDPNIELQESGWEELRREARKIEGELDVKLSLYLSSFSPQFFPTRFL
uniref:Uncharacterized protein n=1 Tax=Rhizophora mucronata TaxID=61149 RepID=A0A2P2KJ93_RHIMU